MRFGWSSVRDAACSPDTNKWYLVGFYSSVITMMHGPTNIKFTVNIIIVIFVVFNMAIAHLVQFLAKESEKLKKVQFQLSLHLCSNCACQCDCTLAVRIYHATLENIQQSPNNEMVINTKWLLPHSTHLINQPPSYPRRLLP